MPQPIRVPRLGDATSGTLVEWYYAEGDTVMEGNAVAAVDLDKATVDIESPASGRLRVKVHDSSTVPVGEIIGWVLTDDGPIPDQSDRIDA